MIQVERNASILMTTRRNSQRHDQGPSINLRADEDSFFSVTLRFQDALSFPITTQRASTITFNDQLQGNANYRSALARRFSFARRV